MSSSPPAAPLSLPPSNPNQPAKKRPSASAASHNKRQRVHPLSQTSFPASQDSDPRVYSASATSVVSEADGGSVTGSFTGSFGGGSVDGKGGRKRKKGTGGVGRKGGEGEGEREGSGSLRGTVVDGGGLGNEEGDGEEEGDEGDEGDLEDGDGHGDGTAREAEAERKNLAILIDAFTPAQSSRYDFFKRAKLNKPMVRKIVNQTLSQSVPPNVITTISGYTKVFVGELVEKARTVQEEWADAADRAAYEEYEAALAREEAEEEAARVKAEAEAATVESAQSTQLTNTVSDTLAPARTFESSSSTTEPGLPSMVKTEPKANGMVVVKEEPSSANDLKMTDASVPQSTISTTTTILPPLSTQPQPQTQPIPQTQPRTDPTVHTPPASQSFTSTIPNSTSTSPESRPPPKAKKPRPPFEPPPNPHRGQLLPAHLREALRRYKLDGESGGVGFGALSMGSMGIKGSFTCGVRGVGGRRLFQ
ncbi:transcription initiation factor TFIID subunit 11 [Blastomyces parvus]|uniref:Transcription initiation factor TFIID subunit 11 n=2 Tax=Blastomyces parvus TaxID=2060905 RepID=A0A2B7X5T4_9EURO|nr:transcription initiation factor TFIID subunit 11 [Blastomyces parvus]